MGRSIRTVMVCSKFILKGWSNVKFDYFIVFMGCERQSEESVIEAMVTDNEDLIGRVYAAGIIFRFIEILISMLRRIASCCSSHWSVLHRLDAWP